MEEQLAALAAEVAALKNVATVGNTTVAEIYYYVTIPLMVLIHAGFLAYEMGASRSKNVLASGIKNILRLCLSRANLLFLWVVVLLGVPNRF